MGAGSAGGVMGVDDEEGEGGSRGWDLPVGDFPFKTKKHIISY